jgi:Domain of unknown function (DUF4352)
MTEHETSPSPGIESPAETTTPARAGAAAPPTAQTRAEASARAAAEVAAEKALVRAERWWFARKRVTLPSAVVIVFGIIMATTGGNDTGFFRSVTNAAQQTVGDSPTIRPATAVLGKSVRDGKFAFTVTSMEQPAKSFTDRFGTTQTAQGVFVVVRMDVTNIGYEARTLTATDLYLVDHQGQRYATSSAISSLAGAETIFYEKINPGHTVSFAPVLFDVAPGTEIASIELHDSMSSTGVRVKLP